MPSRSLDDVPEVTAFLVRLGVGPYDTATLHGLVGRNDVWAGTTTSGRPVLVKKLSGDPQHTAARMRRLLAYERFAAHAPAGALVAPPCLGWHEPDRLIAFDYLEDAVSGAELMVDERFDEVFAAAIGRGLALLHDTPYPGAQGLDVDPPLIPSLRLLEGLPEAMFMHCSAAELQAWALLQRDEELADGLRALLDREREATRVLAHCDLRVDQILRHGGRPYLLDWEEFRLADAARDVGSFAGEWLYRAMLDIVTHRGDGSGEHGAEPVDAPRGPIVLDARSIVARGVTKLERLRPTVEAFWGAYRSTRRGDQAGLAVRAAGFAGWHLLDRLLAGAANSTRLQPVQRAAAGVGRNVLLAPDAFAATLGLDDTREVAA